MAGKRQASRRWRREVRRCRDALLSSRWEQMAQSVQMVMPLGAWMSGWAPFLALMAMGPSGVG